jgi:ABC-type branched-subunit amino acid transport system substrate-binding protein
MQDKSGSFELQLRRRSLGIVATALAAVSLAALGSSATCAAADVEVGLLGNLTGALSTTWGIPFKNGLNLALADAKKEGVLSGVTIELKTLDAGSEVTKAVTAFNQFAQQKVAVVISDASSPIGAAVGPLANDAKIVFLSGSGTPIENKEGYAFHFADLENPTRTMGKYLVEKGIKRPGAIVAADFPSFPILAEKTLTGEPIKYVSVQNVTTKDSDFSAVITNLKKANIDGVVLSVLPSQAGNIIQQLSDSGLLQNVTVIGTISISEQTYAIAGKSAVGMVFPQQWARGAPKSAAFEAAYLKEYGAKPSSLGGVGYQVGWIVAAAIADVAKSGKAVTGETVKAEIPAASISDVVNKYGVLDLALDAKGDPTSMGALATFTPDGEILRVSH